MCQGALSARPILLWVYPRQRMRSAVPKKILNIVAEIDSKGSASLTRLTALKQWFDRPGRLPAFGLWVARRASARKGKTPIGSAANHLTFPRHMPPRSTRSGCSSSCPPGKFWIAFHNAAVCQKLCGRLHSPETGQDLRWNSTWRPSPGLDP